MFTYRALADYIYECRDCERHTVRPVTLFATRPVECPHCGSENGECRMQTIL